MLYHPGKADNDPPSTFLILSAIPRAGSFAVRTDGGKVEVSDYSTARKEMGSGCDISDKQPVLYL